MSDQRTRGYLYTWDVKTRMYKIYDLHDRNIASTVDEDDASEIVRKLIAHDDALAALRSEQGAHSQALAETRMLSNRVGELADERNGLEKQLDAAREEASVHRRRCNGYVDERNSLQKRYDDLQQRHVQLQAQHSNQATSITNLIVERDTSRRDFQKLWEENKQLGEQRDRAAKSYDEVCGDRASMASRIGDLSRKLVSVQSERDGYAKAVDQLRRQVKAFDVANNYANNVVAQLTERLLAANMSKRKVAQERDRCKHELESKTRVCNALHDELRQWRSGILQRPSHPLGGVSLHGVALHEVVDRETAEIRREVQKLSEDLRIKTIECGQIKEAYENLRQQTSDTAAGIEARRLQGELARVTATMHSLSRERDELVGTIATIRDLVGGDE